MLDKKYLLLTFVLACIITSQAGTVKIYPEYRPIKATFSLKATALAATVKALESGDLTFENIDDFNTKASAGLAIGLSEEILDDIKILLSIAQSTEFEAFGELTDEQAQEILFSPLGTEALIALADENQKTRLIGFRLLVAHLLKLECRYNNKEYLKETRALLIKLGVFNPQEDILPLNPSYNPQY